MFVKIVDHDLRVGVPLELDDNPRVFIRFVADGGDVGEHLSVHQLRNPLYQRGAVHVVRNLGHDDLFLAAFELLDAGFAAHLHAAASGLEVLFDS